MLRRVVIIVIVLGLVAGGAFLFLQRSTKGLPKSVLAAADFPVYYPDPLPLNYHLVKDSPVYRGGTVFYSLNSGNDTVRISEQALPTAPPDLSAVPGFKKLETISGSGIVGLDNSHPVAVLQTNTTLLSLNAGSKTPQDHLSRLAAAMSALPD